MSIAQHRNDILHAYSMFSPASVDVIARIEHMQQIPDIHMYCDQLYEEGLLLRDAATESGVTEYKLTDYGRNMVNSNIEPLCPTKLVVFEQLRTRENTAMSIRSFILETLRSSPHFLSIIQLQHCVAGTFGVLEIAELHSLAYGLLFGNEIVECGPLFGVIT